MGETLYFRLRSRTEKCRVPNLRSRWSKPHYVYFLLAGFDILTVCLGLLVTHSIMSTYTASVAGNATWNERLLAYSRLGELAEAVDAPGNDVFDSHDAAGEEQRLRAAAAAFDGEYAVLRAELEANLAPPRAEPLVARLDTVKRDMEALTAEARLIFSHFKAGRLGAAGEHMATMDRKYAVVSSGLAELRNAVARIQQANFEEQMAAAARVQKYEVLVAALVLLMVAAATLYGQGLARQAQRDTAERERHVHELAAAKARLQQHTLLLESTVQRMEMLLKHALESHEEKNKSIAHELHEEVAQMLASLKMRLELLRFEPQAKQSTQVEDVSKIAKGALDRLRDLVRDLTPHGIEDVGLAPVLAAHLRDWTRGSGLRVHFAENTPEARPPAGIETAAYRIAKELVRNAVRHAHARSLSVELRQSRTALHLYVEDDGVGFDVARAAEDASSGRLGIISMQQHTALLGGTLEIRSRRGDGTTAHAVLPLAARPGPARQLAA